MALVREDVADVRDAQGGEDLSGSVARRSVVGGRLPSSPDDGSSTRGNELSPMHRERTRMGWRPHGDPVAFIRCGGRHARVPHNPFVECALSRVAGLN
jgi:hypothetical protein